MRQPDGITCGPTCIKMVADHLGGGEGITVQMIASICGTNPQTGTTDITLKRGLDALGITYIEHTNYGLKPLRKQLKKGSIFILRTLMSGQKHWIITEGLTKPAKTSQFKIADPGVGRKYTMTDTEVDEICSARDWQVFEIPQEQDPEKFLSVTNLVECWPHSVYLGQQTFEHVSDPKSTYYELNRCDRKLSLAVKVGDQVVGAYFLSRDTIFNMRTFAPGLTALCGVGLVMKPEFKKRGYGSMLRAIPASMGVDYVWGWQLKALKNIDDWKKRRIVFQESSTAYQTVEIITLVAKQAFDTYVPPPPKKQSTYKEYLFDLAFFSLTKDDFEDMNLEDEVYLEGDDMLFDEMTFDENIEKIIREERRLERVSDDYDYRNDTIIV